MTMKLEIKGASVSFGAKEILKNINFEINEHEKIAIVGRNGSGKTTLLKLISGELEADNTGDNSPIFKQGKVEIGYMHQVAFSDEQITLEEEILKIFKPVLDLKSKLEKLEVLMQTNPTEKVVADFVATEHNFEINGGYSFQKDYNLAFKKFGFSEADKQKKLCEFSGGQKTKIGLVKLLFLKPDILILDEPTNHLDTEAIEWLEDYLSAYQKSIIIVSHDRAFIDNVANVVYEIENHKLTKYVGNYTKFIETKKETLIKKQKEYISYTEEVNRLQTLADRFRYKATKAAMAQSKLKQIERMEEVEKPELPDDKTFKFKLEPKTESALEVLKLDKLKYGYSLPLGEVSAKIYKGERIAIVGGNGLGKSTLLKTIMSKIPLLGGKIKFGQSVEVGYFDQQAINELDVNLTVLESFLTEFPELSTLDARKILGGFMFTQDDVFKKIGALSGGEKVRLELAKIFKHQPNFLILDEPTNHLDILGKETLEDILENYEGTILFVSHDRYFVKKLANGIISLSKDVVEVFKNCTYSNYETKHKKAKTEQAVVEQKTLPALIEKKPNSEYKKNKDRTKRILKLERDIQKFEEQISGLNEEYNAPENCSNVEKLMEITEQIAKAKNLLENCEEEWLKLMEEEN